MHREPYIYSRMRSGPPSSSSRDPMKLQARLPHRGRGRHHLGQGSRPRRSSWSSGVQMPYILWVRRDGGDALPKSRWRTALAGSPLRQDERSQSLHHRPTTMATRKGGDDIDHATSGAEDQTHLQAMQQHIASSLLLASTTGLEQRQDVHTTLPTHSSSLPQPAGRGRAELRRCSTRRPRLQRQPTTPPPASNGEAWRRQGEALSSRSGQIW
jgi:hypothetical protein